MKILFLCGSLAPGRDGVGDYTRRLAGELIRQGHQVQIIALFDKYISTFLEENQLDEEECISTVRFPASHSLKQNIQKAKVKVNEFNPDWISLQFVPFAFQAKGLAFHLASDLSNWVVAGKWHIFFHELWVGMEERAGFNFRLWGWLQKKLIFKLIYTLQPELIHTQSLLYQTQLRLMGIDSEIMPLFSNIPMHAPEIIHVRKQKGTQIIGVVFGSIHPNSLIRELLQDMIAFQKEKAKQLVLHLVGRTGTEEKHWKSLCNSMGIAIQVLGEQNTESIAEVLSRSDFGISTTPWVLSDKSGSVAAMRLHRLNILCIAPNWQARGVPNPDVMPGVFPYRKGAFAEFMKQGKPKDRSPLLSTIAVNFIRDLKSTNHGIL